MKNEIITGFNKEAWIPDIEKEIAKWEDFSKSIFCENAEDKELAMHTANELREFLEALKSDTVTRQQYKHISLLIW